MIKLSEEFLLVHDRIHASFLNDAALVHLLHGIKFFLLFFLDLPDLAEATATNHIMKHKVILVHSYKKE